MTDLIALKKSSAEFMNGVVTMAPFTGMLTALDQSSSQGTGVKRFKNIGWYATGSVYEEWISDQAPSITPPSGHTLTNIQHYPI